MAIVALASIIGLQWPTPILFFTALLPVLMAPSWVVGGLALWRRWWVLATLAIALIIAHLVAVIPGATADDEPQWVAGSQSISVLQANIQFDNPSPAAAARRILAEDADVVVINEYIGQFAQIFDQVGLFAEYPNRFVTIDGAGFQEMIMTRLPSDPASFINLYAQSVPELRLTVDGQPIRIFAAHYVAPKRGRWLKYWNAELSATGDLATSYDEPVLVVGDFNASAWHRPYREMLQKGFTDAHDALGESLSMSWTPQQYPFNWPDGLIRLDHAVFTDGLWVTELRNIDVPGSDHQGMRFRLQVRPGTT